MTTAPVVCNSSPLIGLGKIGQLSLLQSLFGTIKVAPAVVREVSPGLPLPDWIEQQSLASAIGPRILAASLGSGESETISLALEVGARLVILDDLPARRLAQALSLPMIGTLGILLAGKRRGLLSAVRPCLDDLLTNDFRIAPALHERVLRDAGEAL